MTSHGKDLICDTVNGSPPLVNDYFHRVTLTDPNSVSPTATVGDNIYTFWSTLEAVTGGTATVQTVTFTLDTSINLNNYYIDTTFNQAIGAVTSQFCGVSEVTANTFQVRRTGIVAADLARNVNVFVRILPR